MNKLCFPKNESLIKGDSFNDIHKNILFTISTDDNDVKIAKGLHKYKHGGEDHAFTPDVVMNLQNSLKKGCRLDFIESFNNEPLGESGSRISGGQRQRIGIARALARNPEILFLDEAFNGIDLETSLKILSYLKQIKITTILISHNIKHLDECDNVIKLGG